MLMKSVSEHLLFVSKLSQMIKLVQDQKKIMKHPPVIVGSAEESKNVLPSSNLALKYLKITCNEMLGP